MKIKSAEKRAAYVLHTTHGRILWGSTVDIVDKAASLVAM